jgi:hypothetical protein
MDLFDITNIADFQPCSVSSEVSQKLNCFKPCPEIVSAVAEVPGERWLLKAKDDRYFRVFRRDKQVDVHKGEPRHYASTKLPTLACDPKDKQTILIALYDQVGNSWRYLSDVRFKVLTILPAVSVVMWVQLLTSSNSATRPGSYAAVVLSFIGAALTLALYRYDRRNDELYDDLISRGRKIEEELGVDTGVFRGRRKPVPRGPSHGRATGPLYRFTILGWLLVLLWFVFIAAGLIFVAPPGDQQPGPSGPASAAGPAY